VDHADRTGADRIPERHGRQAGLDFVANPEALCRIKRERVISNDDLAGFRGRNRFLDQLEIVWDRVAVGSTGKNEAPVRHVVILV
jgi:hypothetical protein